MTTDLDNTSPITLNPTPEIEPERWPQMPDGYPWDGRDLMSLNRSGACPFKNRFDVNLLIQEVEDIVHAQVVDIPRVYGGTHNYVNTKTSFDLQQSQSTYDLNVYRIFVGLEHLDFRQADQELYITIRAFK